MNIVERKSMFFKLLIAAKGNYLNVRKNNIKENRINSYCQKAENEIFLFHRFRV